MRPSHAQRGNPVLIREGTVGDLAAVAEIEKRCFPDPWAESMLRESFVNPAHEVLVACSEGRRVVGYCLSMHTGEDMELLSLAVHPRLRRQGIGTTLLGELMSRAGSCCTGKLFLDVRRGNRAAIRLYATLGFARCSVRRRYYSDGEDAVVMCRSIHEPDKPCPEAQ